MTTKYIIARSTSSGEILGGVGLMPDPSGDKQVEWVKGYAVKATARN